MAAIHVNFIVCVDRIYFCSEMERRSRRVIIIFVPFRHKSLKQKLLLFVRLSSLRSPMLSSRPGCLREIRFVYDGHKLARFLYLRDIEHKLMSRRPSPLHGRCTRNITAYRRNLMR